MDYQSRTPKSAILVVLPAFNEEENIGRLLERIADALEEENLKFSILVVNDGSCDRTADVLKAYTARLPLTVEHPRPEPRLGRHHPGWPLPGLETSGASRTSWSRWMPTTLTRPV